MNRAKFIFPLALVFLLLCAAVFAAAQSKEVKAIDFPEISAQNAKLPITFSWINFDDPSDDMPAVVEKRIKDIIIDFQLQSNGGDSSDLSKAKDHYFNTICAPFNKMQLYIVVLKTQLSYSHCKLFLYDSVTNKVSPKTIDYNTWSMYSIDDATMKRSELFKSLQLNDDDIVAKRSNLLLRRLKHVGKTDQMEEITYRPNGVALDSVSFKSAVIDRP